MQAEDQVLGSHSRTSNYPKGILVRIDYQHGKQALCELVHTSGLTQGNLLAALLHHEPLALILSETESADRGGFGHLAAGRVHIAFG